MRPCLFGVLLAMVVGLGGCAHILPGAAKSGLDAVATSRLQAHDAGDAQDGWAPIIAERGGPASDLKITPVSSKGPHAVAHSDGHYLLDSGDQLRIFVYGQPNLSRIYTVDHTGNIMMPLIGIIKAQRRTTDQLAGAIRSRLGAEYVRDPSVTVDMHQNRPFFILGEVRTPGQYPYVNGMTVETAVAIAGGYTPRASHQRFRISRRVDGTIETDQGDANYVVQPGDTINVSERFF